MLYELVYHSVSANKFDKNTLLQILRESREFNATNNITGCLIYSRNQFIQILEGEKNMVKHLFRRIVADNRHKSVSLLYEGVTNARAYGNWSMAYQNLNKIDTQILRDCDCKQLSDFLTVKNQAVGARKLFYKMANTITDGMLES